MTFKGGSKWKDRGKQEERGLFLMGVAANIKEQRPIVLLE